jgi:hypothetical protein
VETTRASRIRLDAVNSGNAGNAKPKPDPGRVA